MQDCWTEWLLNRRFGSDDDAERKAQALERLRALRDRVLDGACLKAGDAVLDVGSGDGLIGFGALERQAGQVIFSDISDDLLAECKRIASQLKALDRCRFVRADATELAEIPSQSVNVVTTRSVLIYVGDKASALREFYRVIRPGGRISLFEPICKLNRFLKAYDPGEVRDLDDRVKGVFEKRQPTDSDPMYNFDDRDLLEFTEAAGFQQVFITLEIETKPPEPISWDSYASIAFNPKIPTINKAMKEVLAPDEQERYEAHMRPLVESGQGSRRMASVLLRATKAVST